MAYQISGLDEDNQLWIVKSDSKATAEHLAEMFRKEGYSNVAVKELPDA
ncbi:hypothetical protein [Sphingopyxis terrae]|nr:hypothetical protein [Sphingopyxis terrae]